MSWQELVIALRKQGKSWEEVTCMMSVVPRFQELSTIQIYEIVRKVPSKKRQSNIKIKPRPVGVFSDIHAPFDHPGYLPFLIDTFKYYNVGRIVENGDTVDHHALSRFQSEPCAMSSYDELERAIKRVKLYTTAFPEVDKILGNHDDIPLRQAASLGIGKKFLKSFSELLELPKGWKIHDELVIDNVLYKHGMGCCGKDGALDAAIQERMSTVIGHSHAFGGCKYSANKRSIIFGLNAGCGIDISAYAFAYGKHAKYRPTIGCGIVYSSTYAQFIPMGAEYFDMGG